jgi:hypothetical protein
MAVEAQGLESHIPGSEIGEFVMLLKVLTLVLYGNCDFLVHEAWIGLGQNHCTPICMGGSE